LKPQFDRLTSKEQELVLKAQELERLRVQHEKEFALQRARWAKQVQADQEAIRTLSHEKSQGFPWLAQAYADFFHLQDMKTARHLETKSPPAKVSAKRVREIAAKRQEAERLGRIYRYQLEFYESLFPWLVEFREIDDERLLLTNGAILGTETQNETSEAIDPVSHYLSPGEYEKLTREEKFQLALDRYWQSRKTRWQIGRDYERYVGYLYEKDGWDVTYFGIIKGFEDLGRDLLVHRDGEWKIVQCKCWAEHKLIHEKHVFQLFGTTLEYWLSRKRKEHDAQFLLFEDAISKNPIIPVLYTSTSLSDTARDFAKILGVEVHEKVGFQCYPCIKCNYTKEHDKIYHLPFDQQYDRTKIQDPKTERYVSTVSEAEALGYRRAYRWNG
jgi:DUF2075 family protein